MKSVRKGGTNTRCYHVCVVSKIWHKWAYPWNRHDLATEQQAQQKIQGCGTEPRRHQYRNYRKGEIHKQGFLKAWGWGWGKIRKMIPWKQWRKGRGLKFFESWFVLTTPSLFPFHREENWGSESPGSKQSTQGSSFRDNPPTQAFSVSPAQVSFLRAASHRADLRFISSLI